MDDPGRSADQVIRTLIVTDVSLFLEGLGRVLDGYPEVLVVGSATPDQDVAALVGTLRPDVVLVDATTVRASEVVPLVTKAEPPTRVVAFAIAVEDEEEVLACAGAGVSGYVARNATVDELIAVLRSAAHGEVRCPPRVTSTIFRQVAKLGPFHGAPPYRPPFTPRELEIVSLLDVGLTNKEIASQLGIEVATVKNHVHNILEKLQIRRRAEVATRLHPLDRRRRLRAAIAPEN
jgi:two-component system, NarL family, nitrate/nitrite response regulator NarL